MKILVGVDGGASQPDALALTAALADASPHTEVTLVHVYPWDRAAMGRAIEFARAAEEDAERLLDAAATAFAGEASVRVIADLSPARGLCEMAEDAGTDIIVLGACHRGPMGRTVLGSVSDHVVHGAPCAVAVAPRGYADATPGIASIGVGYDDGAESGVVLRAAERLALAADAKLVVYSIFDPPLATVMIYPTAAAVLTPTLIDDLRTERGKALERAVASLDARLDSSAELLEGPAATALAEVSEHHDLFLVGSRGYGPLGTVLLGSVSRALVHHASCAVLIVPKSMTVRLPPTETLSATFVGEAEALAAVTTLLNRGVPGEDLRILRGSPVRDARETPHSSFVASHGEDPIGTFAGTQRDTTEGRFGGGDAHQGRLGSFGDADREYSETFPGGVENVSQVSHHRLVALIAEAGIAEEVAHRDVEALHIGRAIVLARVDDRLREDARKLLAGEETVSV